MRMGSIGDGRKAELRRQRLPLRPCWPLTRKASWWNRSRNWLIKNRRGAQWNSTRDTAIVVLAMNDYLRTSGELAAEMEYELIVNGTSVASKKLGKAELLSAPSRFQIAADLVKNTNDIRIRRKSGSGAIYFAVEAKFLAWKSQSRRPEMRFLFAESIPNW